MVAMNDEDAADIVRLKLFDHKILVGSMWNKIRLQIEHPNQSSKGKSIPFPAILGRFGKSQVFSTKKQPCFELFLPVQDVVQIKNPPT